MTKAVSEFLRSSSETLYEMVMPYQEKLEMFCKEGRCIEALQLVKQDKEQRLDLQKCLFLCLGNDAYPSPPRVELFKSLLNANVRNTNAKNEAGRSILYYLVSRIGDDLSPECPVTLVKLLVNFGADVRFEDPLTHLNSLDATLNPHVLEALLIRSEPDEHKGEFSPLYRACEKGYYETIRLLHQKGAKNETNSKSGKTSSQVLREKGSEDSKQWADVLEGKLDASLAKIPKPKNAMISFDEALGELFLEGNFSSKTCLELLNMGADGKSFLCELIKLFEKSPDLNTMLCIKKVLEDGADPAITDPETGLKSLDLTSNHRNRGMLLEKLNRKESESLESPIGQDDDQEEALDLDWGVPPFPKILLTSKLDWIFRLEHVSSIACLELLNNGADGKPYLCELIKIHEKNPDQTFFKCIQKVLEDGGDAKKAHPKWGLKPLDLTLNPKVLEMLLEKVTPEEYAGPFSPLYRAAIVGNWDAAEILVNAGARNDVNRRTWMRSSFLLSISLNKKAQQLALKLITQNGKQLA